MKIKTGITVAASFLVATTALGTDFSSPGGAIPPTGTGGGSTWPDTSGLTPLVVTFSLPSFTVTGLEHVTFSGLAHTWAGDVHAVLESPAGTDVTIFHRAGFTGTGFGNSADFDGGIYRFEATGPTMPDAAAIPAGTYGQDLGVWADGDTFSAFNGEDAGGIWTLRIFDWAAGDTGSVNTLTIGVLPAPGALALLGLAGLASRRRRRA